MNAKEISDYCKKTDLISLQIMQEIVKAIVVKEQQQQVNNQVKKSEDEKSV